MAIRDLNKDTFDAAISKPGVCVVEFYSESCKVCKLMFEVVEKLSSKHKDINFYKIDAVQSRNICSQRKILSLPTFLIFKDGIQVEKIVGFKEQSEIEEIMKKASVN